MSESIPTTNESLPSKQEEKIEPVMRPIEQKVFLDKVLKEKKNVSFFLQNKKSIMGKVIAQDHYTVLIQIGQKNIMLYKHSITSMSTVKTTERKNRTL